MTTFGDNSSWHSSGCQAHVCTCLRWLPVLVGLPICCACFCANLQHTHCFRRVGHSPAVFCIYSGCFQLFTVNTCGLPFLPTILPAILSQIYRYTEHPSPVLQSLNIPTPVASAMFSDGLFSHRGLPFRNWVTDFAMWRISFTISTDPHLQCHFLPPFFDMSMLWKYFLVKTAFLRIFARFWHDSECTTWEAFQDRHLMIFIDLLNIVNSAFVAFTVFATL